MRMTLEGALTLVERLADRDVHQTPLEVAALVLRAEVVRLRRQHIERIERAASTLERGWLARQIARTTEDIKELPDWLRRK